MRAFALFLMLSIVALLAGCRSSQQAETVRLTPPEAGPALPAPVEQPHDTWQAMSDVLALKEPENTRYFDAARAPACPEIEVTTAQGKKVTLTPGDRGYVEPGNVTLVLFWNAGSRSAQAAARHVDNLTLTYRQWRVQAVSIVETGGRKDTSRAYADQYGLAFPLYYEDDASALEDMSGKVDADPAAVIPSIFIVDRQMRLRFFRGGFRFTAGGAADRPDEWKVLESAPLGRAIEDYLQTILKED